MKKWLSMYESPGEWIENKQSEICTGPKQKMDVSKWKFDKNKPEIESLGTN